MSNESLKDSVNQIISDHIVEFVKNNPLPEAIYRYNTLAGKQPNPDTLVFELVTSMTKPLTAQPQIVGVPSSLKQLFINEAYMWIIFNSQARKFDLTIDAVRQQISSTAYTQLQLNWMRFNKIKKWNRCRLASRGRYSPRAEENAILSLWFDAIQYKLVVDQTCNTQLNMFFAKQFETLHGEK